MTLKRTLIPLLTIAVFAVSSLSGCRAEFEPFLEGDTAAEMDGDDTNMSGTSDANEEAGDPVCGDGVAEGMEECDGADLQGAMCAGFSSPGTKNFSGGTLSCSADCTLDFSSCEFCGDGVLNGDEECDGGDLGSMTCSDMGFDGGELACNTSCGMVETGCSACEGDSSGMYGTECDPLHLSIYDGHTVCFEDCETSADCVDPSLEACEPNYICLSGGCRIACDTTEDCPTGMACVAVGWCAWPG